MTMIKKILVLMAFILVMVIFCAILFGGIYAIYRRISENGFLGLSEVLGGLAFFAILPVLNALLQRYEKKGDQLEKQPPTKGIMIIMKAIQMLFAVISLLGGIAVIAMASVMAAMGPFKIEFKGDYVQSLIYIVLPIILASIGVLLLILSFRSIKTLLRTARGLPNEGA